MIIKCFNTNGELKWSYTDVKHISTSTSLFGARKVVITLNDNSQYLERVMSQEIFGIWED